MAKALKRLSPMFGKSGVARAPITNEDVNASAGIELSKLAWDAGEISWGSRTPGSALEISYGNAAWGLLLGTEITAAGAGNQTDFLNTTAIFNFIHNYESKDAGTAASGAAVLWANYEIDNQIYGTGGHSAGWFSIWADAEGDAAHIRSSAGPGAMHLQAIDAVIVTGAAFDFGEYCDLYGIRVSSSVNSGGTLTGNFYGIMIEKSGTSFDFDTGIDINDCGVGIDIGDCTTGVKIDGSIGDATGRGFHAAITQDITNHQDGYGANEFDLTITGTSAGHVAGLSSWVNMTEGTHGTGGTFIAAQTNGVYEAAGADVSAAKIIAGMRMQYQGAEQPAQLAMLSMASPGKPITAMWEIGQFHNDIGCETAGGHATNPSTCVRFMVDAGGNVKYIRLYDDVN